MMASQMYTGSDASEGESSATQLIPLLMGKRRSLASGLQWLVLIKTCKTMHEKYALNNEITQVKPLISRFSWENSLEYRNYTDLVISFKITVIPHWYFTVSFLSKLASAAQNLNVNREWNFDILLPHQLRPLCSLIKRAVSWVIPTHHSRAAEQVLAKQEDILWVLSEEECRKWRCTRIYTNPRCQGARLRSGFNFVFSVILQSAHISLPSANDAYAHKYCLCSKPAF